MEAFSVRTNITLADWHALQKAWTRRHGVDNRYLPAILMVAGCAVGAYGLMAVFDAMDSPLDVNSLFVGLILGAILVLARWIFIHRKARPDAQGSMLGQHTYEFSAEHLRSERKGLTATLDWSTIKAVEATPEHIFLWTDRVAALIVPVRDLPPGLSQDQALARLREFASQGASRAPSGAGMEQEALTPHTAPTVTTPSVPNATAGISNAEQSLDAFNAQTSQAPRDAGRAMDDQPSSGWGAANWPGQSATYRVEGLQGASNSAHAEAEALQSLRESAHTMGLLATAGRLWTLRRLTGPLPAVSDWVFVVLITGALALWVVLNWAGSGVLAKFWPYSPPYVAWFVLLGVALAWVFSRRSFPPVGFRNALLVLVLLAPVVAAAAGLAEWFLPYEWLTAVYLILGAYVIVYLARAAHSVTGRPQVPVAAAAFLLIAVTSWYNSKHGIAPRLWYSADSASEDATADVDSTWERGESLLFDQAARIDAALARIKPPASSDRTQVYFVGLAGYGEQRVFAEEIKLAAYNVGRRYGSGNRSVLLINDRRDLDKNPLATVSGLRHALKGIAARMNVERDVLFLALSSHGSDDPQLSVSNGLLTLKQLNGEALASALKDSGIKRKVIVISACHAGAFMDVLRDAHTVILTAAAAERTSFGCSDDRDLTYFGEAFYRDALPSTASLRAAFDQATQNIEAREKDEDIKASHPQAFYGAETEAMLAEIEPRAAPPNAPTSTLTTRTAP